MKNQNYNQSKDNPKEEYMKRFGERLKSLRKSKRIRITFIIAQLNIHRSTYASWESGRRFPSIILLVHLADLLKTNIDYLLLRTDFTAPFQNMFNLQHVLKNERVYWGDRPITEDQRELIFNLLSSMMNGYKSSNLK